MSSKKKFRLRVLIPENVEFRPRTIQHIARSFSESSTSSAVSLATMQSVEEIGLSLHNAPFQTYVQNLRIFGHKARYDHFSKIARKLETALCADMSAPGRGFASQRCVFVRGCVRGFAS